MPNIPIVYPVGLLICLLIHTVCMERVTTYLVAYHVHDGRSLIGRGTATFDAIGGGRISAWRFEDIIKQSDEMPRVTGAEDVMVYSIQKLNTYWRWKWEKKPENDQ